MNGNHETMNVLGDFRYVTPRGFRSFDDVTPKSPLAERFPSEWQARAGAFLPRGRYATFLAERDVIVVIGDTVFVHGGVRPPHVDHGIGRLNAETFIVETIGINDRTWLDDSGYPHSDALKITERMRRLDFGRLEIEFTFDDPKTYTRPWSANVPFELVPDTELLEYVCENERDLAHVGGK